MNAIEKYIDKLEPETIRNGIAFIDSTYICLCCGKQFEYGEVFPEGIRFFDTETAANRHFKQEHPDYTLSLIALDKNRNGLTETQRQVMRGIYQGQKDIEIAGTQHEKGASAIRNMRFHLRKRAREAKVFLGIMGLLEDINMEEDELITFNTSLPIDDDRTKITRKEERAILGKYITEAGSLSTFPKKQKEKLVLLNHIIRSFETGKEYTEKEVNGTLQNFHEDYVTLRRYLIEYNFFQRTPNGTSYWRK